jgi:hypothetical protein
MAQEETPPARLPSTALGAIGELPADQAGAGRGYALAGEGATVAEPGTSRIAVHMVAANYFYREQTSDYLITQRYESHTLALDFRRGSRRRAVHGSSWARRSS